MPAPLTVYLFHWPLGAASGLAAQLETDGFSVTRHTGTQGTKAKQILESGAAAVVIDLSKLPSHGGAIAAWVRGTKSLRHLPIVFVNGDPVKVERMKQKIPDAVYTGQRGLPAALRRAIREGAPAHPVIPPQMMESTRSTAEKMGIRPGDRVAVLDAPRGYAQILGPLPPGATLLEDAAGDCAVVIWFIHDATGYRAALPQRRQLAAQHKLWVAWPKGRRDGLNSNLVRETGIGMGLVDYKICSIDEHWSGIAFAVKKVR